MRYLLIILFTLTISLGHAQDAVTRQAIAEVSNAAKSTKNLQADFVQSKSIRMLGDKMVAHGRIKYQQGGKLRWEYTRPYSYTFIISGSTVTIKKADKHTVIDITQNKLFRSIAEIMMSTMTGSCLSNTKDFRTTAQQTSEGWALHLTPQRREVKQMFERITLYYHRASAQVTRILMQEKGGDTTEITLSNPQKNKPVDAKAFIL